MKTVEMKKCNFVLDIPTWESVKKAYEITLEHILSYTNFICNENEIIIQYNEEEYVLTKEDWEKYMAGNPSYCCFRPKKPLSGISLVLTNLYWVSDEEEDDIYVDEEIFWENETPQVYR